MRLTTTITEKLYRVLNVEALTGEITGKIYRHRAPLDEDVTKENIVITTLPISGDAVQECFWNVNVYVPDLEETNTPDIERLEALGNLVAGLIENWNPDESYHFTLDILNQGLLHDEKKRSFLNIRGSSNVLNNVY